MPTLIEQLADVASATPDAVALEAAGAALSYDELLRGVAAVRDCLRDSVGQDAARIAIMLDNSVEYVESLYGVWAAGCTAVPINAGASARELQRILQHSGAAALIADSRNRHAAALAKTGIRLLSVDLGGEGQKPWTEYRGADRPLGINADDRTPAQILYTSGTTGRPKGVLLTHENLSANTASIRAYLEIEARDRVLSILPFHYSYGNSVLHTHLSAGATLLLGPSMIYPQKVLDALRTDGATGFSGVAATFSMLLGKTDWLDNPPDLRYVTQAGGPMSTDLTERLLAGLREGTRLYVMYGQTEASARITWLPPEKLREKRGSVGIPIDGCTVSVVDEAGEKLPAGETGEVIVRGSHVMTGYWNDAAATALTIRNGWLHTGDLGYLDGDGFLFLVGRSSDIIKSGAHRINPAEIEEVISETGIAVEFAVCGVADEIMGQAIHAVLVGEPDPVKEQALMRYCKQQLAMHKLPRKIHWHASLPKTASGKIKRQELAAKIAEGTR